MNNKIIMTLLLCWVGYISFAQESKMGSSEIEQFKTQLAKAEKTNTLEADFTQYKKVSYVKNEIVSSGKFYIKNPDRLAWLYNAPMQYSMIFKDRKIYINNKGKKQNIDLRRNKQFEKISQAIQSNTGSEAYQSKEFTPSYFQNTAHYILKLDPIGKDAKKALKQIVLYFDKKDYKVQEFLLIEPTDDYTRFVLRNQKINQSISDSVFAH